MTSPQLALLVEQNDDAMAELAATLAAAGLEPVPVTSPTEAVSIAATLDPTFIIVGSVVDGMDNIQLVAELRKVSSAFIILLGQGSDEIDVVAGLDAGADSYLPPPINGRVLRARMIAMQRRPGLAPIRERAAPTEQQPQEFRRRHTDLPPTVYRRRHDDTPANSVPPVAPDQAPGQAPDHAPDQASDQAPAPALYLVPEVSPNHDWLGDDLPAAIATPVVDAPAVEAPAAYTIPAAVGADEVTTIDLSTVVARVEVTEAAPVQNVPTVSLDLGPATAVSPAPESLHFEPLHSGPPIAEFEAPVDSAPAPTPEPAPPAPQPAPTEADWLEWRSVAADRLSPRARIDGAIVDLTADEHTVFLELLSGARKIHSRASLARLLLGIEQPTDLQRRAVDDVVAGLYAKIGDSPSRPRWIETVPGIGYRRSAG